MNEAGHASQPEAVAAWLSGRLPDAWFTGAPQVLIDRDEITIIGSLAPPETAAAAPAAAEAEKGRPPAQADTARFKAEAEAGRLTRFREETRDRRMTIAREAEYRYGRKVAWGASAGATTILFTTLSVPVMTRLRQPERQVLDTLVDAGVARSRSDALAWCVRLVGRNTEEWLAQLREAMTAVEKVRGAGPAA